MYVRARVCLVCACVYGCKKTAVTQFSISYHNSLFDAVLAVNSTHWFIYQR